MLERVPIDSVMVDASNVRKHPTRNLQAIKASLAKFGQQSPLIVDANGVVLVGNGRLEAARQLGWTTIDVVRTDLSGAEAIAYAIADNRTAELAEWDDAMLAVQLEALRAQDATLLEVSGFDAQELEAMRMPDFTPASVDEQGRLDVKLPIQCPECGHEFTR